MNILVLGAGPGGLSIAWNLVKDGHRVLVLEKEDVWGGQSITFERGGFRYDLGPHNIHSKHAPVLDFLERNLEGQLFEWQNRVQIYFQRRRIQYPLLGVEVLKSLPLLKSLACVESFLFTRARHFFLPGFRDDGTYRTWIINRFGKRFYDIFFGPYSEKAWGLEPEKLSDIVAKKRIPTESLVDLIHSIIFKREKFHSENPRLVRQLYPRKGIGQISDYFAQNLLQNGGRIQTGCSVNKIILSHGRVVRVEYSQNGTGQSIDLAPAGRDDRWQLISTIPLNEMVMMLEGDVPDDIVIAASGLDFTSEVFLYLNIGRPAIFGIPLLYFSEKEFPFNRAYDVGLFSREMVPSGKNALCLELTCGYGDRTWEAGEDEIFESCMKPLERHGLLFRKDVESYFVRRLRYAYPRFRVGYQEKLKKIFGYLDTLNNLKTFGRGGLFSYANVDDVIWMGFELAKNVPYQDRMPLPIEAILPQYIDF